MSKPIKRDPSIQPLSRDHHLGLLLCWKIRKGFSKKVSPERIKAYADWFFETHLKKHFEIEEKFVFTILGIKSELIKQALKEHRLLEKLFLEKDKSKIENSLTEISGELEKHIRFEERILFNDIQSLASAEDLENIREHHTDEKFCENTEDEFWK